MRVESEDDFRQEHSARHEIDLAGMGRALGRRKFWILGPTLLCCLGAAVAVNWIKPRYTAEAKILIENQENYFTQPEKDQRTTEQLPDDEAVQSQVQLVSSRDIAREAIKTLHLQGDPEFDPVANGLGAVGRVLVLLGLERDPLRIPPEDRILSSYFQKLEVYPLTKSRVLSVQFTATDPDLAAKAANTVSDLYINLQSSAKRDSARSAAESLGSLIADLKVRAAEAETKAQEFRGQNGLLVGANNTTLTAQQLADLNTQLAQSRTSQADAQAKAKLLRDMIKANRISEVPDVANNDMIRRISDQRMLVQAQIAQLSQTLLPGHPRMQELRGQLNDYDAQLRTAADKVVRTLENDAHIAAGRVENLQAALDAQKQTATTAGADEVTLNNLELQAKLLKDQLEFNTQKYQEAVAREHAASTPADARVISRAIAPAIPSFPRKLPMIAIFTMAGLVLSIGVLIARELLSGRAFMRNDVPGSLPVDLTGDEHYDDEFAGHLRPTMHTGQGMPFVTATVGEEADPELASVLDGIERHRKDQGGVRILVTAADTATAILPTSVRLARGLARNNRVILVDCGIGGESLEEILANGGRRHAVDEGTSAGLFDLLAGQTSFADVIHRDPLSRLHLVPLGGAVQGDEAETFGLVADALAETYDYVVFVAPLPDAEATLPVADRADLAVLLTEDAALPELVESGRIALHAAGIANVVATSVARTNGLEAARSAA